MGINSIFPSLQEGHFAGEGESSDAAIILNILEERHEAHQKHEGHNVKCTRLSISSEILVVVLSPPSRTSKVLFLKIVCSLSINI